MAEEEDLVWVAVADSKVEEHKHFQTLEEVVERWLGQCQCVVNLTLD